MGAVSGFNSRCGKFISVCNQPPRSTQPGHSFVVSRNEYQPKSGDASRLRSRGRYRSYRSYVAGSIGVPRGAGAPMARTPKMGEWAEYITVWQVFVYAYRNTSKRMSTKTSSEISDSIAIEKYVKWLWRGSILPILSPTFPPLIAPPQRELGLRTCAYERSGVTRVGDTRGGNWWCHPSTTFFSRQFCGVTPGFFF